MLWVIPKEIWNESQYVWITKLVEECNVSNCRIDNTVYTFMHSINYILNR